MLEGQQEAYFDSSNQSDYLTEINIIWTEILTELVSTLCKGVSL